jgi:chromatin segregation and condensation protein Rec8/ScpA/Scc1 (kleisin family)
MLHLSHTEQPVRLTEQNGKTQMATSTAKKAPKSAVVIKAPKLVSAWNEVCSTSAKSENEIVKAIENLSATMKLESRLTVAEQKKFIKGLEDGGKVSSFIKSSHAPALLTWSKLRSLHADFRAFPIAKQLSTASASYDLLGAGNGEQIKTLDALMKEIATVRKNKNEKSAKGETSSKSAKAPKDTLAEILAYFTALNFSELSEDQQDQISEINAVLESKMISA